jgi:hypothetical protein
MNRTQKIEALQEVFRTGNKAHLEDINNMVIHTIVIEKDGMYQIVPIEPTFTIPNHELTLKDFEAWKSSIPLFPDIN